MVILYVKSYMRLSYDCMLRKILHLVDKRAIAKNDNQTNVFLVYFAKFHLYISLKKARRVICKAIVHIFARYYRPKKIATMRVVTSHYLRENVQLSL